jgi:hypothetical protein
MTTRKARLVLHLLPAILMVGLTMFQVMPTMRGNEIVGGACNTDGCNSSTSNPCLGNSSCSGTKCQCNSGIKGTCSGNGAGAGGACSGNGCDANQHTCTCSSGNSC